MSDVQLLSETKKRKQSDVATAEDDLLVTRELVCELCRQFFIMGWVTGTGGSISIREPDGTGDRILMTPSGVPKERIKPDELFVIDSQANILCLPKPTLNGKPSKLSECAPLFLHAFNKRHAGAVIHSHGIAANLVTTMFEGKKEFVISHQEMIKGISNHGYFDELKIPIIENTAFEHELADSLAEAIDAYPKSVAVLVRRHGVYIWGDTWQEAKRHAECIHYLFELAIKMQSAGVISPSYRNRVNIRSSFATPVTKLLLDIEGTLSPISFVREKLFPYAAAHVRSFVSSKWSDNEAQSVFRCIFDQMKHDEGNVNVRSPPLEIALKSVLLQLDFQTFVFNDSNLALWINAIDKYLQWSIAEDIKLPYLKNLQALIWEAGYSNGDLIGHLFADVAPQLALFYRQGVKIYIYSSGSRRAQKLLFQHSSQGDITYLLSGFFDTSIGSKMDVASYESIGLSIGLTNSDTLFITDLVPEAIAAKSAGFQVILSDRPGNSSLEGNHGFEVISSLTSLST